MSVLTHFPQSRLSELVGRFGGLTREEAVAAATQELEVMRPESDKAILHAIGRMQEIVTGPSKRGDAVLMEQLLPLCDQLVTLAGTFGYRSLDNAARSLCDLLEGLTDQGKEDLASIRVHVQTIQMFSPSARLSQEHVEVLLLELQKLLDFHGIIHRDDSQSSDDDSLNTW